MSGWGLLNETSNYGIDIDGNQVLKTIKGKELENLFNMVNSAGFLDGETYDGFMCQENQLTKFKTFHFFFQGETKFSIPLGFNSVLDIGAQKISPAQNIEDVFFVQGQNNAQEPIGSILGVLFAVGGSNIIFTLIQDQGGLFELQNNNQLINTALLDSGEYKLIVQVNGQGGDQYTQQINVIIGETALISNINLSNVTVEETAPIGTIVGSLSTVGGQLPITYTILEQKDDLGNGVDVFDIDVNDLITKAPAGSIGDTYSLLIQAEDSRTELPDEQRLRVEPYVIEVVADTFINTNSLSYNGVDELIEVLHDISLWSGSKFSGSFWVKPNNIGAAQYIASKFGAAGDRSWGLRINSSGTVAVIYSQNGTVTDTTTTPTALTFGNWHHVAFSFNGTLATPKMKIWLNGALDIDEDTALTSLYNNTNINLFIGALWAALPTFAQSHFSGLIDEVSLYSNALTNTQVQEIYNSGVPSNLLAMGSSSDLISWWRMGDNFTANTDPDEVGNNDGDGINMTNSNKSTDVPS